MQTFILPPTAAEDLALAPTRLWLNAFSPLAANNTARFRQHQSVFWGVIAAEQQSLKLLCRFCVSIWSAYRHIHYTLL